MSTFVKSKKWRRQVEKEAQLLRSFRFNRTFDFQTFRAFYLLVIFSGIVASVRSDLEAIQECTSTNDLYIMLKFQIIFMSGSMLRLTIILVYKIGVYR